MGLFLGVAIPLGFLVFSVGFLIYMDVGELLSWMAFEKFADSTAPWLSRHTFIVTLLTAYGAAGCHLVVGLYTALRKLPAPVTSRQQAYLPLGVMLGHWALLMGSFFLILAVGTGITGKDGVLQALLDAAWAFPLGLLIIALVNRNAGSPTGNLGLFYLILFSPQFALVQTGEIVTVIADIKGIYPSLLPVLLFLAILVLWETPRHRQNWHRAAFIPFPMPIGSRDIREPLAPQRLHPLSVIVNAVNFCLNCAIGIVLFIMFALMISGPLRLDNSSRMPLWVEQLLFGVLGLCIVLAILYFIGKTVLLYLQNGRYSADKAWAQWVLRITYGLERSGLRGRFLKGKIVVERCPKTKRYLLCFQRTDTDENDRAGTGVVKPFNFALRFEFIIVGQIILMSTISGTAGRNISFDREGSNIQGDAQIQPNKNHEIDDAFSQHYVALDLGKSTSLDKRKNAFTAIQAVVANNLDPTIWLADLKMLDGEDALVPATYRVEVSQPESHIVVVQSMGLHWAPAGHLAFGLAKYIQDSLEGTIDLTVDPDFFYIRPADFFLSPMDSSTTPCIGYALRARSRRIKATRPHPSLATRRSMWICATPKVVRTENRGPRPTTRFRKASTPPTAAALRGSGWRGASTTKNAMGPPTATTRILMVMVP